MGRDNPPNLPHLANPRKENPARDSLAIPDNIVVYCNARFLFREFPFPHFAKSYL
jgi:hypothetical protein